MLEQTTEPLGMEVNPGRRADEIQVDPTPTSPRSYTMNYGPDSRIDWGHFEVLTGERAPDGLSLNQGGTHVLAVPDERMIEAMMAAVRFRTIPLPGDDPRRREFEISSEEKAVQLEWEVRPENFNPPASLYDEGYTALVASCQRVGAEALAKALPESRRAAREMFSRWQRGGFRVWLEDESSHWIENDPAIVGLFDESEGEKDVPSQDGVGRTKLTEAYTIHGAVTRRLMDKQGRPEGTVRELDLLRDSLKTSLRAAIISQLALVGAQEGAWQLDAYDEAKRRAQEEHGESVEPDSARRFELEHEIYDAREADRRVAIGKLEVQRVLAEREVNRAESVQFIRDLLEALACPDIHVGILSVEQSLKYGCKALYTPYKPAVQATDGLTATLWGESPEHPMSIWIPLSRYGTDHVYTMRELMLLVTEALASRYMAIMASERVVGTIGYQNSHDQEASSLMGEARRLKITQQGDGRVTVEHQIPTAQLREIAGLYNSRFEELERLERAVDERYVALDRKENDGPGEEALAAAPKKQEEAYQSMGREILEVCERYGIELDTAEEDDGNRVQAALDLVPASMIVSGLRLRSWSNRSAHRMFKRDVFSGMEHLNVTLNEFRENEVA